MTDYAFDIECFPNFTSVTFLNIETEELSTFVIHKIRDDRLALREFLNREILLIGYNCIYYDSPMLVFMMENLGDNNLTSTMFQMSQELIDDSSRYDGNLAKLRYPKNIKWQQMDLMKILAFDKLGISLKQTAINLKWHKIQDLPYPIDRYIGNDEIQTVVDYNVNDVLITFELYKSIKPLINLRHELGKLFGVNLTSASDSKMANLLLESIYCQETGIDIKELKNQRTKRDVISLKDCIGKNIEFQTDTLNALKQQIENTVVRKEDNFKYKKVITFGGVKYEIGIGGLHSVDDARMFKTTNDMRIVDCDVASFYPNIILANNLKPEHLDDNFLEILRKITSERLNAKKKKDRIRADGLKITINSIFGKLGSETFWLEDSKQFISVTVSGQLYLLMLIEALNLGGIEVISANTDGVVVKVPASMNDKYMEVGNWWQEKTGFELEFTDYDLYVRSDVNNYITKKHDGKTKEKGRYVKEIDLKRAYKYPIVPRCLYEYFVKGKEVDETLSACTDILDFCISQKTGKDFILEYHDGEKKIDLQKTNRFYISNTGGTLIKHHRIRGNNIGLMVGNTVQVLNDYDKSKPFSEYNVNLDFYRDEVFKYINKIVLDTNDEPYTFIEGSISDIEISENETEKIELLSRLRGMKNLSEVILNNLIKLEKEFPGGDFLDLLVYAEENRFISLKYSDLIKIGYFEKYGGNKKLLNIFAEFKTGKSKYTAKLVSRSKSEKLAVLRYVWERMADEKLSIKEQMDAEIKILGKIVSKFNVSPRYCYVVSINDKYSPRVILHSLLKGTQQEFRFEKRFVSNNPFITNDILYCTIFDHRQAVQYIGGQYVKNPDRKVWWVINYRVLTAEEIERLC